MNHNYDLILIGSGFASSFFLAAYLKKAEAKERILIIERGPNLNHQSQLEKRPQQFADPDSLINRLGLPGKRWQFSTGFGGSSNCWWGCAPRMLPNDFTMKSTYGVATDWPIGYLELEPYYEAAEEIMSISGPSDVTPYPRKHPHPQAAHRFNEPDRLLKAAYPDLYFIQPTARARAATNERASCCANGVCGLCPVDAKFTILNGMKAVYDDPRVSVLCDAEATRINYQGDSITGLHFNHLGKQHFSGAGAVGLGANAIFNPLILLNSGIEHPLLGRRLHEQVSWQADIFLDGLDNFQGSTSITGHGYMLYDGPHRKTSAACLIEHFNTPNFRFEPGRWRQRMQLKLIFEELPHEANRVEIDPKNPKRPNVIYSERSDYLLAGAELARKKLPDILSILPIEDIHIADEPNPTEGHILGTTVAGSDPDSSVVDADLRHHQLRNLLVLGSSVFPTGAPANPTLTISALSLRAADKFR